MDYYRIKHKNGYREIRQPPELSLKQEYILFHAPCLLIDGMDVIDIMEELVRMIVCEFERIQFFTTMT